MHNHPSGDPTPSQADIQMTKAIIGIAAPLGTAVHDHIIVGKNGHASLKGITDLATSPWSRADFMATLQWRRAHIPVAPRSDLGQC